MRLDPANKCALAVKPVVWSANSYRGASGPKAASGFVADHGYGGEEWNNVPTRVWKRQRVFHAQSTEKLDAYAAHGNLALLMIAMHEDVQYLMGLACGVRSNSDHDMDAIAKRLNLAAVADEVWEVEAVRRSFKRRSTFVKHWNSGHQTLQFRCPVDLYNWFEEPVPIPKYPLGDKMVLVKRHGTYQGIRPEDGLRLMGSSLGDGPARTWLIEREFDEAFLSAKVRKAKQMTRDDRRREFGSAAAAVDPYTRYIEKCVIHVDPRHGPLESRFVSALRSEGITLIEQNVSNIDAVFVHPTRGRCIVELKPADPGKTQYPIRHAVGQILEYRHFKAPAAQMLIVLGARPMDEELQYLGSIGIGCGWEVRHGQFEYRWPSR